MAINSTIKWQLALPFPPWLPPPPAEVLLHIPLVNVGSTCWTMLANLTQVPRLGVRWIFWSSAMLRKWLSIFLKEIYLLSLSQSKW